MSVQGRPPHSEALQGLDTYEHMVNTFAEQAKTYWRLWGSLGDPMLRGVDAWVEVQRAYIIWLREFHAKVYRP